MKYVFFPIFIINNNLLMSLFIYKKYFFFINTIIIILAIIALLEYKNYNKQNIIIIAINIMLEIIFNYSLVSYNIFFLFSSKIIQFIFSIHLNEIIYINKKSAKLIIPYILWNFILTLLTTLILFLYAC